MTPPVDGATRLTVNRITSILMIGSAVVLAAFTGQGGEKIIFSGRDGQAISFDFSRQVRLLPAELDETRLDRAAPADPGAFAPLGDPSLSPSALRRRKPAPNSDSERDWIFQKPGSKRSRPGQAKKRSLTDPSNESAMLEYMKGDSAADRGDGAPDDSDGTGDRSSERKETPTERRQPLNFKQLAGMADGKMSLLRKAETEAGFGPSMEKQDSLNQFLKADLRRQDDVRHRRSMSDFRQRIVNPFGPVGGNDSFGKGTLTGDPGGLMGAPGLTRPGGLTDGGLVPNNLNSLGSPGAAGGFNSRSMPATLGAELPFRQQQPKRVRPKPISLDIQKRDF